MRINLIFLILLSTIFQFSITAQSDNTKITITGNVLDVNKKPIVNAIVMIDGQKTKTLTNSKGNFKIRVNPDNERIGIFTFNIGMLEELISGRTQINFNFPYPASQKPYERNAGILIKHKEEIPDGEQAVDVGYAVIKKKYLSMDIDFIDGTKTKYQSYPTVADMIIREVSGVRRYKGSIIIQESSNFFGPVPPLILIDGMPGNLGEVEPYEIKSIAVLKGNSAAIFGSRGYGGAIIIRTKTYDEN
jgi:TonB-dependent starch-binding outer membrane protein SusC